MSPPTKSQRSGAPPKGVAGPRPGVILVAHGSARSAASAEPILALAEALRSRGFPEVRSAYWKEEPFLHQALELTRSSTVVVLPVFLAEGYFSHTVVPRELDLHYGDNDVGDRRVHLLPPLAAADALAEIVEARAQEAAPPGDGTSAAALVVLGHGTPRDPGSADTVLDVCACLARGAKFARVAPAFIDQEPRVENVLQDARETLILLVPFLVAPGWHGGTTVPRELDLGDDSARHGGQRIIYTEPVGTHPAFVELAEALLLDAVPTTDLERVGSATPPLSLLESVFEERLARSPAVVLIQVMIRAEGGGVHELRHVDDDGVDPAHLADIATGSALGRLTRHRGDGGHRPLRTAADLPLGWRLRTAGIRELVEALVEIYGPALVHWYLGETGGLTSASFREAAARQTGMYAMLAQVEAPAIEAGISRICDGFPCLRTRLWGVGDSPAREDGRHEGGTVDRLVVPCPRPCPILLSGVVEVAAEGEAPEGGPRRLGVDDPPGPG